MRKRELERQIDELQAEIEALRARVVLPEATWYPFQYNHDPQPVRNPTWAPAVRDDSSAGRPGILPGSTTSALLTDIPIGQRFYTN